MSRGECPNLVLNVRMPELQGGCFSDEHHLFFPKFDYRDIMSAEFRNLPENKEQICRWDHDERHANEPIPDKPSKSTCLGLLLQLTQKVAYTYLARNKKT